MVILLSPFSRSSRALLALNKSPLVVIYVFSNPNSRVFRIIWGKSLLRRGSPPKKQTRRFPASLSWLETSNISAVVNSALDLFFHIEQVKHRLLQLWVAIVLPVSGRKHISQMANFLCSRWQFYGKTIDNRPKLFYHSGCCVR